jgi:hypothetical protein
LLSLKIIEEAKEIHRTRSSLQKLAFHYFQFHSLTRVIQVKGSLKDSDTTVRFAAVQAISEQETAPELAIPLLIVAMKDNDERIASHAVQDLNEFGTNASSACRRGEYLVERKQRIN